MTDLVTGWTENASIRNNASQWIVKAVATLQGMFPFPLLVFDLDNGSEFINHDVADWLEERDIAQTRACQVFCVRGGWSLVIGIG